MENGDRRNRHQDGVRLLTFNRERAEATTIETDSSHVPMLSQPEFVIDVIRKAAAAVQKS